jgi:hypothetical protein
MCVCSDECNEVRKLLRGTKNGFEVCTVDHQKDGKIRVDATITYRDKTHEVSLMVCL